MATAAELATQMAAAAIAAAGGTVPTNTEVKVTEASSLNTKSGSGNR